METPASLAEKLDSLDRAGRLDTVSLKQVLELISNMISDSYARNATTAISTLEDSVRFLLTTYDESKVKSILIESLKTEKLP